MSKNRTREIKIRLTEDEHSALIARATSPKLAEWIRETCLDTRKPVARKIPLVEPKLLRSLSGIGNNVNQIARALNNDPVFDRIRLYEVLISIERELQRICQEHSGDKA